MTVTPSVSTPVTPGIPGATIGADASDLSAESSGLFAQLMAALVPQAVPAAPAPDQQPTQGQPSDTAPVTPAPPGLVTGSAAPSSTPAAAGLPTTAPSLVPGRKAIAGTPATAPAPDAAVSPEPATDTAPRPTTPPTAGPVPGLPVGALATTAEKPQHPSAADASQAVSLGTPTGPSLPGSVPAGHSPRSAAEPVTGGAAATSTPVPANAVAPAGVPTPTSTGQPASTATPAPLPVSRQVIPELTRMSTLGEGVHRLTMTLRPEALGEVRVTMTVRDGSLHVRLAAGAEAQHALVPDLTELQQVLKLGNSSDVRVVLRDLSGVPSTPDQQSGQTGNQTGSQQGPGHHAGQGAATGDPGTSAGPGHQNRREAGTPRDINATDGVVDGTSGSRSQAVRRARPTGVDLTM